MIRTASAIAALSVAGLASAGSSFTFDLSGIQVDGAAITTLTNNFGFAGSVTNVSVDVSLTTNPDNISWQSEALIGVWTDGSPQGVFGFTSGDFGAPDTPGTFAYTASFDVDLASSDGIVNLDLWDTFDDAGFDYTYNQGSSVTITYIPAPAGMATLAGAGLLAARRRRA